MIEVISCRFDNKPNLMLPSEIDGPLNMIRAGDIDEVGWIASG